MKMRFRSGLSTPSPAPALQFGRSLRLTDQPKEHFEMTIPVNYELVHHLQRVFDSPEFEAARKEANKTLEEMRNDVEKELKAIVQELRRVELHTFEKKLSAQALGAAKKAKLAA